MPNIWIQDGSIIVDANGAVVCDDCPCDDAPESDCSGFFCRYQWDETSQLWTKVADECNNPPPPFQGTCTSACVPPPFDGGCDFDTWEIKPCNDPGASIDGWKQVGDPCP